MLKRDNKNGFMLLGLLIAIAIIVMLYMVNLRGLLGPDRDRAGSPYEERPWFEEQRLLAEKDFPVKQTGKKGKVVINNETTLTGTVQREDTQRGDIEIVIDPNGKAIGRWSCAYEYPDSSYSITAEFTGNIDPTKTFENETGKNPRLLYLITKGKYEQIKTDKKTGYQWPTEQIIYVVGWIYPVRDKASPTPDGRQKGPVSNGIDNDFSANGKLFLMADNDEESYGNAEYDWQTKITDKN
jgi:hypothetical protein